MKIEKGLYSTTVSYVSRYGRTMRVEAYPPSSTGHVAQVNWSAFGSMPVDEAEEYAGAILEACKVARELPPEKPL